MSNGQRIAVVMPYFGKWPEWFPAFLESCRWNPVVTWVFFTDCGRPQNHPPNVEFHEMSLRELSSLISSKMGFQVEIERPYKLCDFRWAYGHIFSDFILEFDWFGWGDVDIIFGKLDRFLTPEALSHDIITFSSKAICGHLTLVRNSTEMLHLYRFIPNYRSKMLASRNTRINELNLPPHRFLTTDCPPEIIERCRIYTMDIHTTPHSPFGVWVAGERFPEEWVWKSGELSTVPPSTAEFPFLHFMFWKNGLGYLQKYAKMSWRELEHLMYVDEEAIHKGFRVTLYGFHPLHETKPVRYKQPMLVRWLTRLRLARRHWLKKSMLFGLLKKVRRTFASWLA